MLSVRFVAMSKIIINRVKSPDDENMSRERRNRNVGCVFFCCLKT